MNFNTKHSNTGECLILN